MAARVARRTRATDAARSFYKEALTEAERSDLPVALEMDDLDQEIALLRLRLRSAIEQRPDDLALMFKGIELLARAVATRYRLSKRSERDLASSLGNVVRSLGDLLPEGARGA